jgi:hypothetical protein
MTTIYTANILFSRFSKPNEIPGAPHLALTQVRAWVIKAYMNQLKLIIFHCKAMKYKMRWKN